MLEFKVMLDAIQAAVSPVTLFWLVALIIFAVAEAATVGLVSLWFAGGALVALIVAGVGGPIWLQIVLFLAMSCIMLALLRPMVRKISVPHRTRTNADRHLGQTALVTEEINNLKEVGAVRLDGVVWSARSESGQVIPVDTLITVQRIQGVKVWVTPAEETAAVK